MITLDFETRSECDLKRAGAWVYSCHPSTQAICLAYKLEDQPTRLWKILEGEPMPGPLDHWLNHNKSPLSAHNAFFEWCIFNNVLKIKLPHERFTCTASMAAALALPRHLAGLGEALKLPIQKDMEGHRLMLRMSKPRKPSKLNPAKWNETPEQLERLYSYCIQDVEAEYMAHKKLKDLIPQEREVWLLDQKINSRGIKVDLPTIDNIIEMVDRHTEALTDELVALTEGKLYSAKQVEKFVGFLTAEGYKLENLQSKTIDLALASSKPGIGRRLLEIRKSLSKASVAKYEAFKARAGYDGRIRDLLLYHGASTGRWAGTGIQPQNFPKGKIKDVDRAIEVINNPDEGLDFVKLLWGDPMEVASSCLRGMIIADEGKTFYCADYAAIEARMLLWVADDKDGLKAFYEGRDLYKEMAVTIYSKPINQITKDERQLGKAAILGAGYGMGPKKFKMTCESWGIPIDEALAEKTIRAYRSKFQSVVKVWQMLEKAAVHATRNQGKVVKVFKTEWTYDGEYLFCKLPSGRSLAYYGPEIRVEATPWGEPMPKLYHWSVNPISKKWELGGTYGGKLTENIIQAISRDIMAEAMLRCEKAGYSIVLSVHDELLAETPKDFGSVKEFEQLLAKVPQWAQGAPISAEGWTGPRYKK